jgi:hypothetical protein
MGQGRSTARRIACGAGGVAMADMITGMAAYSVISLGALWFFAWSWIRLTSEAASRGIAFGSPGQLQLAWFGLIAALPLIPIVVYLARQAYRVPLGLVREARRPGTGRLRALVGGTP